MNGFRFPNSHSQLMEYSIQWQFPNFTAAGGDMHVSMSFRPSINATRFPDSVRLCSRTLSSKYTTNRYPRPRSPGSARSHSLRFQRAIDFHHHPLHPPLRITSTFQIRSLRHQFNRRVSFKSQDSALYRKSYRTRPSHQLQTTNETITVCPRGRRLHCVFLKRTPRPPRPKIRTKSRCSPKMHLARSKSVWIR